MVNILVYKGGFGWKAEVFHNGETIPILEAWDSEESTGLQFVPCDCDDGSHNSMLQEERHQFATVEEAEKFLKENGFEYFESCGGADEEH